MTLIEVLVVIAIVGTFIGLFAGAVRHQTSSESWSLKTVRHDGHQWVTTFDEKCFVHHPDCDLCSKGEQQP